MYFLTLSIDFEAKELAKNFFISIKPEIFSDFDRSKTKVTQRGSVIGVEISASDKTALRASFNSIYKPLMLFKQVEELK